MAARLNKLHQEDIRSKIQASQLINVLQDHALNGESEISASRMKAIEILLRKSVADLSAITVSGDPDNPLGHAISLSAETQQLLQQVSPGPSDTGVPGAVPDGSVLPA
jgi:hypothetical protein